MHTTPEQTRFIYHASSRALDMVITRADEEGIELQLGVLALIVMEMLGSGVASWAAAMYQQEDFSAERTENTRQAFHQYLDAMFDQKMELGRKATVEEKSPRLQ